MKKLLLIFMVLILAGTVQAIPLTLVNPGFEDAGNMPGWTKWAWNGGSGPTTAATTLAVNPPDANVRTGGLKSCKTGRPDNGDMTWNKTAGGSGAYQYIGTVCSTCPATATAIPIGAQVTLEGWAKTNGHFPMASLVISYFVVKDVGRETGRHEYFLTNGVPMPNWTYGKVVGMVPSGVNWVKFEVANLNGEGFAYFDDLVANAVTNECPTVDPNNLLFNESFECADANGDGHGNVVPTFWYTQSNLKPSDVNSQQVKDGTALNRVAYWKLTEANEPNKTSFQTGLQAVSSLDDTHNYRFVVNLRNPGVQDVNVQVGFNYNSAGGENYWGTEYASFIVPADNTWHQYEYSALKWMTSTTTMVRVAVRNGTVHVDQAALYQTNADKCSLAKRDADPNRTGVHPLLPGDLNDDCYVNMADLGIWVQEWLKDCTLGTTCR
jgi:hypothetical protein